MNYQTISKEFGTKLKEEREKRGLSKTEFAKFLGIDRGTERGYEQHQKTPSLEMAVVICDKLGKTLDEFLGVHNSERDDPKMVIEKDWFSGCYHARCPICREGVYKTSDPNTTNKYCHKCGQALRWE